MVWWGATLFLTHSNYSLIRRSIKLIWDSSELTWLLTWLSHTSWQGKSCSELSCCVISSNQPAMIVGQEGTLRAITDWRCDGANRQMRVSPAQPGIRTELNSTELSTDLRSLATQPVTSQGFYFVSRKSQLFYRKLRIKFARLKTLVFLLMSDTSTDLNPELKTLTFWQG